MKNNTKLKLGILGGGQLARMLAIECHKLSVQPFVLTGSPDDSAAQVSSYVVSGNVKNKEDVLAFAEKVDALTFESEFVDREVLKVLKGSSKVFPDPEHMLELQDRLPQKNLLEKFSIATAPFEKIENSNELKNYVQGCKFPQVIKARKDGYDGYGTYIIKEANDPNAFAFVDSQASGVIVEEFVPFQRELAFSVCRSRTGEIECYPLVESFQEECRCLWVKGPCVHPDFENMKEKIVKFLEQINYIGLISFEFFDTGEKLLVNEVAPRVHNSAHYSLDALTENQFSSHIKAIFGFALEKPKLLSDGFAMYNLIGSSNQEIELNILPEVKLHWYGKKENRSGRKMGHLNAIGETPDQALEKLKLTRKEIKI